MRLYSTFPSIAKMIDDIPHMPVFVLLLLCHSLGDHAVTWIIGLGKTLYWSPVFTLVYTVAPKIFTNREVWKEQVRTRESQSGFSPNCSTPSDCSWSYPSGFWFMITRYGRIVGDTSHGKDTLSGGRCWKTRNSKGFFPFFKNSHWW